MFGTIAGVMSDVNVSNGHRESLTASFVADLKQSTVDAVVTSFDGPGQSPIAVHWRAAGNSWIVVAPATRIEAGADDHDYLDLPKLVFPRYFPALAKLLGDGGRVELNSAAARLLGNGRAGRVVAEYEPSMGIFRRYQAERVDGTVLRIVTVQVAEGGASALATSP